MSDQVGRKSGVTGRFLSRLALLAVPVVALGLFAHSALALVRGETATPATQFRALDAAAFAAIERTHTPTAAAASEDVPEVEVTNWENTDGSGSGSGKKF
jgi:hypothetical protein